MGSKSVLSIVTPSYNQGSFIEDTFKSILSQKLGNRLEYILVDAKSTDNTAAVIKQYILKFKKAKIKFKLIREKDKGQSDAINKGWKISTGDILGYLNSDDYYEPNTLLEVLNFFEEHKDTRWAYGGWNYVNKKGTLYRAVQPESFNKGKLLNYCNIGQPSCFFRRSLLKEVGFLNEKLHLSMDYDLWLKFAEKYPAGIINCIISNMRYYSDSKSATKTEAQVREVYNLSKKYSKRFTIKRFIQLFYFLRGLAVIKFSVDINKRIQRTQKD